MWTTSVWPSRCRRSRVSRPRRPAARRRTRCPRGRPTWTTRPPRRRPRRRLRLRRVCVSCHPVARRTRTLGLRNGRPADVAVARAENWPPRRKPEATTTAITLKKKKSVYCDTMLLWGRRRLEERESDYRVTVSIRLSFAEEKKKNCCDVDGKTSASAAIVRSDTRAYGEWFVRRPAN